MERIAQWGRASLVLLASGCGHPSTACTEALDAGIGQAVDAEPLSGCPASPTPGACCSTKVVCTYGTDPAPARRQFYVCKDGQWAAEPNPVPVSTNSPSCPGAAPFPSEAGAVPCLDRGAWCSFDAGASCACALIDTQDPATTGWLCDGPSTRDPRCPLIAPNSGASCAEIGAVVSCPYEPFFVSDSGLINTLDIVCNDYWDWGQIE
jgi:hypothetical protein